MNFKFRRVLAVVYRHLMVLKDPFEIFNYFYWTFLDILLFGFLGLYMQKQQGADTTTAVILLANLTLWYLVVRSTLVISQALLREFWDLNFVGLFSTPLTIFEWTFAAFILGTFTAILNFLIGALMVYLFFGFNIFSLGLIIIPATISLIISGWILGFLTASILVYKGKKAETLAYAISWIFVPFSGVYYETSIMPPQITKFAQFIPMFHTFQGIREYIHGKEALWHLQASFILNIIYLTIIIFIFIFLFNKSKNKGLNRLEVES